MVVTLLAAACLLLAGLPTARARAPPATRVKSGAWLWNCDGAAYVGGHPHGYYTHRCLKDIFESPPAALRGAFHVFPWAQVEPADGTFDWSQVDANLTAMARAGVQVAPTVLASVMTTEVPMATGCDVNVKAPYLGL